MDPTEKTNTEADILAGFDAAIAGASEAAAPLTDPVNENQPDPAPIGAEEIAPAPVEAAPAAAVQDPVPGSPEALAATQAAAGATPAPLNEPVATTPEPAAPARDEAVEAEITTLGLKEKAAERFRNLSDEVKTLAPLREAMNTLGIKDVDGLQGLARRAKDGADMFELVHATGASPEMYGLSLDYLGLVSKGLAGDQKALKEAIGMATQELQAMCKLAGMEVTGVFDPLAEHADLREEVETGGLSRARALEIAKTRADQVLRTARERQHAEANQHSSAQVEATNAARTELTALGNRLKAADPAYDAKYPALVAAVKEITAKHPPGEWALRAELAYSRLVVAKPATAPAASAIRPNNAPARPNLIPLYDDPLAALEAGIAVHSGGR